MRIFFIGDVFGRPGREAIRGLLPQVVAEFSPDVVIANIENAARGRGITVKIAQELFALGIDFMTSGNHIWETRDIFGTLDRLDGKILRPHNYPSTAPGHGYAVFPSKHGDKIGLINLQGRVFMDAIDCPFQTFNAVIEKVRAETRVILLDFHADATAEKVAMGWHVDGRVSACVGTHTHVPTADARILPQGTAYISDVGMTGPYDSIIGMDKRAVLIRFIHKLPEKMEVAEHDVRLAGVIIDIDQTSGRATAIRCIHQRLPA